MSRDPLAAFDADVIEDVAAAAEIEVETLHRTVRRHQESVRELPGVEDIVYEWRNLFHLDPLVEQTPEAYVLAVRDHVWEEFRDSVDAGPAAFDALRTVHDRQARRAVDSPRLDDEPIVLTRP